MTVAELVRLVRSAIDELMVNDSNFLNESEDEKNLTQVIVDKIGYALQMIVERAPTEKLDSSVFETLSREEMTGFVIDTASLVAKVKLPKDLLRIVEARLSSWSWMPEPVEDTSQVALMQGDEYARGSWDRPVNILAYQGSDRYLEMYCAKTAADTLRLTFIRKPKAENYTMDDMDSTEVSVPSLLEAALVYQVAGLAMVAFREDVSEKLLQIAREYMEMKNER